MSDGVRSRRVCTQHAMRVGSRIVRVSMRGGPKQCLRQTSLKCRIRTRIELLACPINPDTPSADQARFARPEIPGKRALHPANG